MTALQTMLVQVCYARPDATVLHDLVVSAGTTLDQAVHLSGILDAYPEIDWSAARAGIYGKVKPRDTVLRERDRVEIYRSLIADPKESRRQRAGRKSARRDA